MSRIGDLFTSLGEALNDSDKRRKLLRRVRMVPRVAFLLSVLAAIVFLLVVDRVGERNIFTTFILFLPKQIWLLPLLGFGFLGLILWDWRQIVAVIVTAIALVWFHFDWETSGGKEGQGGSELVVMTFNRGQRAGSLQPFKNEHLPDIIAMQEAGNASRRYLKSDGYTEFSYGADLGEFMLISKYPIGDRGLVTHREGDLISRIAAWFVVDIEGEEVVIYNVHMPTPRDQLKAFRRGAFLRGLQPSFCPSIPI